MGAVRELLDSTANPNMQDAEGCTPVFLAAQEGHEEVCCVAWGWMVCVGGCVGAAGALVFDKEVCGCPGWVGEVDSPRCLWTRRGTWGK